ncbi:D-alanyl-D-alanine carboxypeptidase/D-alanyl-D-alanine endopeptidase [Salisaeta longa]|uniref:D-alanyl-D-alanine carboxypeptidase/D-alanyl-D-alanine endopeptidase n=1 Tax=Salisaeta longa TaxID=503170 RepID=UPI00041B8D4F|nr:D-alanyl-D-alanine carboxypeptidase/D-alanyl-D-alanine-endopeptidase [Salisaeta longa]
MKRRWFVVCAVLLMGWAVDSGHAQDRALARQLDAVLEAAAPGALWGVLVVDAATGDTLYARNAQARFVPASNIKLFTTAAALQVLPPDFRYETTLYSTGRVKDGVLHGDLYVRGSGDPSFGSQASGAPLHPLRTWAAALKAQGIRQVAGDVIGDDNVFTDETLGRAWAWSDLLYYYAAETSGLSFYDNIVDLTVAGQQVHAPGRLSWAPLQTDYVSFVNRSLTTAGTFDEDYARHGRGNRFVVRSKVPAGRVEREELAVRNATRYTAHVFREVLLSEGISVQGRALDVDRLPQPPAYDTMQVVDRWPSPPLPALVREINHESNNLYAEHLLRTVGRYVASDTLEAPRGSDARGIAVVEHALRTLGVRPGAVRMADGSGLSRQNLATPAAFVTLLAAMRAAAPPVQTAFFSSLPAGGRSGTLAYRLQAPMVAGNVRAKTGSLTGVSALSGYIERSSRAPILFSILANHYTVDGSRVRAAQDALLRRIAMATQ